MINRIDTALEAEEFKHMRNMLEPLNNVSIRANEFASFVIALTAILIFIAVLSVVVNHRFRSLILICLCLSAATGSRTLSGSSPR